jgi:hypothetical protein
MLCFMEDSIYQIVWEKERFWNDKHPIYAKKELILRIVVNQDYIYLNLIDRLIFQPFLVLFLRNQVQIRNHAN